MNNVTISYYNNKSISLNKSISSSDIQSSLNGLLRYIFQTEYKDVRAFLVFIDGQF